MKKSIYSLMILMLALVSTGFAQTITTNNTDNKENVIWVSGNAEKLIMPKEVIVNIDITHNPKMKDSPSIDVLEKSCYKILKKYDIAKEKLRVIRVDNQSMTKRKKQLGVLQMRSYELVISDFTQLDELFYEFLQLPYTQTNLGRFDYGDLSVIKEDLSVDATLKAKRNAEKIAKAIDSNVVRIASIDVNNSNRFDYNNSLRVRGAAMLYDANVSDVKPKTVDLTIKKMSVNSSVKMKVIIE